MSRVAALKRELATAERAERIKETAEFMKPFKALVGRAFRFQRRVMQSANDYAICCGFVLYEKAEHVPGSSKVSDRGVLMKRKVADVRVSSQEWDLAGHKVESVIVAYDLVRDYAELAAVHLEEITVEQFYAKAGAVIGLTRMMASKWFEGDMEPPVRERQEREELDVPHVVLTPRESTLIHPDSVFRCGDGRLCYLITPASIRSAQAQLEELERRESSVAHLLEGCDMAYVQGKAEAIASLRRKLEPADNG